ncbi:MAG: HTH domain-containing protein [Halococcoides sp.]
MTAPSLELFVRSLHPQGAHQRQEATLKQLERLERDEEIDEFSVVVWGDQISRESVAANSIKGRYVLNRVAEFQQWALSNNVSLDSFYQTRSTGPESDVETETTIVLPVMGLAEYRDGELVQVSPCTAGETVHTVQDHVDSLSEETRPVENEGMSVQVV